MVEVQPHAQQTFQTFNKSVQLNSAGHIVLGSKTCRAATGR